MPCQSVPLCRLPMLKSVSVAVFKSHVKSWEVLSACMQHSGAACVVRGAGWVVTDRCIDGDCSWLASYQASTELACVRPVWLSSAQQPALRWRARTDAVRLCWVIATYHSNDLSASIVHSLSVTVVSSMSDGLPPSWLWLCTENLHGCCQSTLCVDAGMMTENVEYLVTVVLLLPRWKHHHTSV